MTDIQKITCPKCQGIIPAYFGQCPVCGEQLQRCPVCGNIYGSRAKFCTKDGSKLIYNEKSSAQNSGQSTDYAQTTYTTQGQNSGQQNNSWQTRNSGQQNSNWQTQNPGRQNNWQTQNSGRQNNWQTQNSGKQNNWQGQNFSQQPISGAGNQFQNNNPNQKKKAPVIGIIIAVCVIVALCIAGIFAFQSSKGNATASTSTSESVLTTPTEGKNTNAVSTDSTVNADSEDFAEGLLTTETSKEIDKSKKCEDDGAYVLWSNQKHVGKLCTIKIYKPGGYLLSWTDDTRESLYLETADYSGGSFEIRSVSDILSDIDDEKDDAAELDQTITEEQTCETKAGTVHYVGVADNSDEFVYLDCWLKCEKNIALYFSYSTDGTAESLKDTSTIEQIIGEIFACVGQKPDDTQTNVEATRLVNDDARPARDENGAYVLEFNDEIFAEYNMSDVSIYAPDNCLLSWLKDDDDHSILFYNSDDGWYGSYSLNPMDFLEFEGDYFDYDDDYTKTDILSCETNAGTVSYIAGMSDEMLEVYSWLQYDDTTLLDFSADYMGENITLNDTETIENLLKNAYSGVV